jgi:hypothetical protein
MNYLSRWTLMVVALAGTAVVNGATLTIDPDGIAVVDGKRTFVLGLYENPSDDAVLRGAVASGINLVRAEASTEALDRLDNVGTWAWLNTGSAIDLSVETDKRTARLNALVADHGTHPALLVWEVPDEALWNIWYPAQDWRQEVEPKQLLDHIGALEDTELAARLKGDLADACNFYRQARYAVGEALADSIWRALGKDVPKPGYGLSTAPARAKKMGDGMLAGYQLLQTLDPSHPVWMNHAPRNSVSDLAYFNRGADIVGCDIYPVPESLQIKHSDLANRSLASVGAYTGRMRAAAPGKPVWMVLQGTGWGDFMKNRAPEELEALRRPTKEESRFMAYDAIVHGARGILYWGSHYVEKNSTFWRELMEVVAELDGLQPVLTAPDAPVQPEVLLAPTHGSLERGVEVLAKSQPEGDWIIVVNTWSGPLSVTIKGFDTGGNGRYRTHGTAEILTVDSGQMTIYMRPYSVAVLRPGSDQ